MFPFSHHSRLCSRLSKANGSRDYGLRWKLLNSACIWERLSCLLSLYNERLFSGACTTLTLDSFCRSVLMHISPFLRVENEYFLCRRIQLWLEAHFLTWCLLNFKDRPEKAWWRSEMKGKKNANPATVGKRRFYSLNLWQRRNCLC